MPEIRVGQWQQALETYLSDLNNLNSESGRSHRFAILLQDLLGVQPGFIEGYIRGIEQTLSRKEKDRIITGRADALFGNVILEFEAALPRKLPEAVEQLKTYTAMAWSADGAEPHIPYILIATDGVHFSVFSPAIPPAGVIPERANQISLALLEESDWSKMTPQEVYFWLDRLFLRQEALRPTSEHIVRDFGPSSHAFQTAGTQLLSLWRRLALQGSYTVVYDNWRRYLRVVYGSSETSDTLFIRHTYLATIAKLMSWMRITEAPSEPDRTTSMRILEGRVFLEQGISNFIEEDFFSWLHRPEASDLAFAVVRGLHSLLQSYRLHDLTEDVLKSLYQELVDPETRHDLGEFYTPDWLAERIVDEVLRADARITLFDPACGSGTFLYMAIRKKREALRDSAQTLAHVLDSVYGIDIHPLAVIIAKTNYVLALGDLLKRRKGRISIPVYLADTLRLPDKEVTPTLWMQAPSYRVDLEGQKIYIPEGLLDDIAVYDRAIDLALEFTSTNGWEAPSPDSLAKYLSAQSFPLAGDPPTVEALHGVARLISHAVKTKRDSIWAFVLKNIYKPLFLRHRFDAIIGNPPWLALKFADSEYQAYLKKAVRLDYRLLRRRTENLPNIEMATIFFLRAAHLYLKEAGRIAFVLPRSILTGDQHDGLRRRTYSLGPEPDHTLTYEQLWDCEGVSPLFNIPAAVLFARKADRPSADAPIAGDQISGILPRKNASLSEALSALSITPVQYHLHHRGKRSFWSPETPLSAASPSYYRARFNRGVNSLMPHALWLVDVAPAPLGFDPKAPLIRSSQWATQRAKAPWKGVSMSGAVESAFLFYTILSSDLLPFSHLPFRLVILPIQGDAHSYSFLDSASASSKGFLHLARWLSTAEKEWTKRKKKEGALTLYQHLDLFRGISNQDPSAKAIVVFNKGGTNLVSAVIQNTPVQFKIGSQSLEAKGFVADQTLYYCTAQSLEEAYYLAAILNAPSINALIKPMQNIGLYGPRDIHKLALELPIPRFSASDPIASSLARLGRDASRRAAKASYSASTSPARIGALRNLVRSEIAQVMIDIDQLVLAHLKPPSGGPTTRWIRPGPPGV